MSADAPKLAARDEGLELPPRFAAALSAPRLPWRLGLLGALLVSPSLLVGFHLDDHLHRYLYSGKAGGRRLLEVYGSPFGIGNGKPADVHWQIEQGYAPWWTPTDFLLTPFRPLSALTHRLDAALWPDTAWAMHLHSVLWYAALCIAASLLYRSLCGRHHVLAGLCGLLYATDYTHGFAVGWIANRNAVISALFGVLALWAYVTGRTRDRAASSWLAAALLVVALLSGEGAIAIVGYVAAHALCLDRAPLRRRALALAPIAVALIAWRAPYAMSGAGARGSGLYLDPAREPLRFAAAALERVPLLLMGELGAPPAQTPLFVSPTFGRLTLMWALVFSVWLVVAAWPLLRRDAIARFFALGMAASLLPACATHPHSRLLYFVGLGAMGLLSRLWLGAFEGEGWVPAPRVPRALTRGFAATFAAFHLGVSPPMLALMACSVAIGGSIQRGAESARTRAPGRDLVVMNAPEFFYVKLIPMLSGLDGGPAPRRLRALSFGAVPLEIDRPDARTLDLRFVGGLMREPLLELYRSGDDPPPVGTRIALEGLTIEVTEWTEDRHLAAARFRFDRSLEDPQLQLARWDGTRFAPYTPPAVGARDHLAAEPMRLGLY
jgi:hypothetical protein